MWIYGQWQDGSWQDPDVLFVVQTLRDDACVGFVDVDPSIYMGECERRM